jgi:NitT/TauT family transport system substrate-binding protein
MKLTPLGKAFLALVIVVTLGFVVWRNQGRRAERREEPAPAAATLQATPRVESPKGPARGNPRRIVVGVNDFGGAYPGLVANDGAEPGPRSRFTAAGLDVEIKLIRGSKERLAAFDGGEVDVMLLTLDYFANLVPVYRKKGVDLRAFLMADWSRGNLGIVTRPGLTSLESLADAKIATTRNTPTHYFLLTLLGKSNLGPEQLERIKSNLVFATKTPLAGEMFKRGEVDAVAIWEPHLSQAVKEGNGRLLVSTTTATHLVADVLYARADFIAEHQADLATFTRVWLEGVDRLQKDPEGSVDVISRAFQQPPAETRAVLSKIKPATFADNRVFFGLERERAPYLALFDDASRVWKREGVISEAADASGTRWLKALEALSRCSRGASPSTSRPARTSWIPTPDGWWTSSPRRWRSSATPTCASRATPMMSAHSPRTWSCHGAGRWPWWTTW